MSCYVTIKFFDYCKYSSDFIAKNIAKMRCFLIKIMLFLAIKRLAFHVLQRCFDDVLRLAFDDFAGGG